MVHFHRLAPLAAALLLACLSQAQAQTTRRSVVQAPPVAPPAAGTPITPGPATPRAAGLPSPMPFPAGIPSLPSTTTPAQTSNAPLAGAPTNPANPGVPFTPPLDGTILMPSTAIGSTGTTGTTATTGTTGTATAGYAAGSTAVMGAGGGPTAAQFVPSGGAYTALQLAESFQRGDANRDGELTRAEFQRLTIAPASFDEMDRNRDGVVSRSEYDDGTR